MTLRAFLNGTHLVAFHAQSMKSDDVIDLLERFDMDVIYRFDRTHEGTPDEYSASAPAEGFELRFDEHQVLDTIFCYIQARGRFSPIDASCIGVPIPKSFAHAGAKPSSRAEREP